MICNYLSSSLAKYVFPICRNQPSRSANATFLVEATTQVDQGQLLDERPAIAKDQLKDPAHIGARASTSIDLKVRLKVLMFQLSDSQAACGGYKLRCNVQNTLLISRCAMD